MVWVRSHFRPLEAFAYKFACDPRHNPTINAGQHRACDAICHHSKQMVQPASMRPQVELSLATIEERLALSNLYQLYVHDFTDFIAMELGRDGRFVYDPLPSYWTEPNRFPHFISADGQLVGFSLVKKGADFSGDSQIWDMAEFFVIRGARRRGIGYSAAVQTWERFPGPWEVRVMTTNEPALQFWKRAISRFKGETTEPVLVTKADETRWIFLFDSRSPTL